MVSVNVIMSPKSRLTAADMSVALLLPIKATLFIFSLMNAHTKPAAAITNASDLRASVFNLDALSAFNASINHGGSWLSDLPEKSKKAPPNNINRSAIPPVMIREILMPLVTSDLVNSLFVIFVGRLQPYLIY